MIWKIIGISAASLTTFSFIPQIIKIYRNKCAKDLSLITLFQFTAGVSLWIVYGFYLRDAIIILANIITLLTLIVLLISYFYWNKR